MFVCLLAVFQDPSGPMSDTEEESSGSDGNWPVNETWLRGILQSNHPNDKDISILVSSSARARSCAHHLHHKGHRQIPIQPYSIATNTCRTLA